MTNGRGLVIAELERPEGGKSDQWREGGAGEGGRERILTTRQKNKPVVARGRRKKCVDVGCCVQVLVRKESLQDDTQHKTIVCVCVCSKNYPTIGLTLFNRLYPNFVPLFCTLSATVSHCSLSSYSHPTNLR